MDERDGLREAMAKFLPNEMQVQSLSKEDREFFDRFRELAGESKTNDEMFKRWRELAGIR